MASEPRSPILARSPWNQGAVNSSNGAVNKQAIDAAFVASTKEDPENPGAGLVRDEFLDGFRLAMGFVDEDMVADVARFWDK